MALLAPESPLVGSAARFRYFRDLSIMVADQICDKAMSGEMRHAQIYCNGR